MRTYGGFHRAGGQRQRLLRFRSAQRLVGFQREFRVDHNWARRVRQVDQTVRPFAVRQRRLQVIAVFRQCFGHDVGQLDFPKRPAGLLVRQDILKAQHIARQAGDIVLRLVDDLQPFLQLRQAFGGLHRIALKAFFHPVLQFRHRTRRFHRVVVQPVVHLLLHMSQAGFHRLQHLCLARGLRVRHSTQPA